MMTPSAAIASATSSLQMTASTAATVNHLHRRLRAAQYAKSNGPIDDRVGMEELPREPLIRGVEEERGPERDTGPLRTQQVTGQQEDGDRAARLSEHLHHEEEDRARTQPIERHQQEQEDVGMVAEQLEPTDRDEGILAPGQQPGALVVDAEVEAERAEFVVAQQRQPDEFDRPQRDEQAENASGQPHVAMPPGGARPASNPKHRRACRQRRRFHPRPPAR